ncbi:autotransporter assembly complex family protein [Paracoccus litorisediminis]|uniref:BamA/TamA family outer membrane protein n=1 Tax=Paracoccus litorisediminis TaxID=2006130 RepID=A0A844HMS1_9RHOB|nr:autotransporter assembly complex family protein [Paracoccus litorisediminis]MTH59041.1 BamA/TamA family outer membrane protein [Paracoccus litorisediminis]
MRRLLKAGTAAAFVLSAGTDQALAQSAGSSSSSPSSASSSPFSGLFGGKKGNETSPVDINISVAGSNEDLPPAIRNTSLLISAQNEGRVTGQDMLAAARGDYARILGVLYDQGYYSVTINILLDGVEAATVAPLDAPHIVRKVQVTVDPGPRFRYSRADIAPVAPGTELPPDYRRGEIARTGDMKTAATSAVEGWRNVGHAKADVAQTEIIADHDTNLIESDIRLAPGPSLTFGEMKMRGYQRMDPRRLRKIAGFPEGERFDPEKLEDVRKRLRRSGVFSAITLTEADYVNADNSLDVDLLVTEQKLRRIGGGFEYSSIDGMRLTGYWMHRNLMRGGERLRIDADIEDIGSQLTGMDYKLGVRIDRPATLHPDITGYVAAQVTSEDEEDYDQKTGTFGLGFTYMHDDELTADIALQFRALQVDDDSGRTDFRLFALPMSVTWDRRDESTDAKRGFWLFGSTTPFVGLQDETGTGAQVVAEGRGYYSFGADDRVTLAGRSRLGTVLGSELEETPRDYLFFSGGGGTVRGQPFESLGVEVIPGKDGFVKTGGMSIAVLNAEARVRVREKIGVVAFVDAGRVWEESGFTGGSGWHAGAGAGLRYDTPIGPMRFDIAHPLGGGYKDDDAGTQLYIGLGQAF